MCTVVSVCRVMGRQALSQGRLGAAIWWGVRSKDAAFTSHLAHQVRVMLGVCVCVCACVCVRACVYLSLPSTPNTAATLTNSPHFTASSFVLIPCASNSTVTAPNTCGSCASDASDMMFMCVSIFTYTYIVTHTG